MKFDDIYQLALQHGKAEARLWIQDEAQKVLVVAGPEGAKMKEHQTPYFTDLILVKGLVKYIADVESFPQQGKSFLIPPHVIHEIQFCEDSIFLLVQQKVRP